ncbi:hypothetical protein SAMN06265173_13813 [Thalassovita litoralis]|uniref:Uncharacterized protein n=1 Tax=Thalassovita litoralis TaxID=1010611 RepID=A0A521FNI5_9RHOB|nr:hypothetical protein SAMN06265173_13813 [Thalassovita litoralis]
MNSRAALSDGRRGLRISRECRASYKTPAAMAQLQGLGDIAPWGRFSGMLTALFYIGRRQWAVMFFSGKRF